VRQGAWLLGLQDALKKQAASPGSGDIRMFVKLNFIAPFLKYSVSNKQYGSHTTHQFTASRPAHPNASAVLSSPP
jgi:hypothetical protein